MAELKRREMIIRYSASGLVLGILLALIFYLVLFHALGMSFTFADAGSLHNMFWFLYLIDIFPVAGLAGGYFAGKRRFTQLDQMAKQVSREAEKNEEIERFVQALIAGELTSGPELRRTDESLSTALNRLKETLLRNRELEQKRRLDEQQRNWISTGLAEFGDILRLHAREMETLTYSVISALVGYLDANQGAFFLTQENGEERYLDMWACHAYDRRKYPDRRIKWGEGLIGAAAMEKMGYYTDKIGDGYLTITSGLGKANPNYLLIEPLLWNEKVFGILEIASFKPMEDYKIQFVQRVAENIATTINTMESNLRTEQLLKETQAQAEQLARQEETVRQNMDALKLAQEEAAKQAEIFISFTNTVNHTLMRAEYDTGGRLIYANTRFLKKLGYSGNREVEGKHISMFINEKDLPWFNQLWKNLSRGGKHFEGYMKHETKMGQDLWTMATYTCMRRDDGSVEKILFLAIDSTEHKKQSLDYEGQIEAIDRLNAKVLFAPDGKILLSNELFRKALKYTDMELEEMNVFDFFGTGEQERFNEIWEKVIRREPFQGQLKMKSKYEEELWFRATFLSVDDMYGEVEKVIFLASEITKEREMEMAARQQHEQLVKKEEELRLSSMDLKKKLEETQQLRSSDKVRFERELRAYTDILEGIPYPLVTINNLGFIQFINKPAEKLWKLKRSSLEGMKVTSLFDTERCGEVIHNFADPGRTKKPGRFSDQEIYLHEGGHAGRHDVIIIRTDLKEELFFTLLLI